MTGVDVSQFQATVPHADFAIIRVGHGLTEDTLWRNHYDDCDHRGMPSGFYYVPETADATGQARFFKGLVQSIPHAMGVWLDYAVGDLGSMQPSTAFVDAFRAAFDCGVYMNSAALIVCWQYERFERLWYAGAQPPDRWLMRQTGGLDQGADIDVAADLGAGIRPGWTGWSWPNL
jgi:hypothetical protein